MKHITFFARFAPLALLAALAAGTALQVGCATTMDDGTSEDAINGRHGYGGYGYGD